VNNHDPQACFLLPWPEVTDAQTRDALEIEGRFVGLKSRDAWIVKAVGEITASTSTKLRKTIDGMCDAEALSMIVDVEDISAIDSAGLGVLASAAKRVGAKGLSFCLVGPSASVRQALRAAGLLE
jgi:anti-anti-sigma factor